MQDYLTAWSIYQITSEQASFHFMRWCWIRIPGKIKPTNSFNGLKWVLVEINSSTQTQLKRLDVSIYSQKLPGVAQQHKCIIKQM